MKQKMLKNIINSNILIFSDKYAVSIKYNAYKNTVPVVTALGEGELAVSMESLAKEYKNIYIINDSKLAKKIYKNASINKLIPYKYMPLIEEIYAEVYATRMASDSFTSSDDFKYENNIEDIELYLGENILELIDADKENDLLDAIKFLKEIFSYQNGFYCPDIRIRDNLHLNPNQYDLLIQEEVIVNAHLNNNNLLSIETKKITDKNIELNIITTLLNSEICENKYIPSTELEVISAHIYRTLTKNISKLFTKDIFIKELKSLKEVHPIIIDKLENIVSIDFAYNVLKTLLQDKYTLRNMVFILQLIIKYRERNKDSKYIVKKISKKLFSKENLVYYDDEVLNIIRHDYKKGNIY